MDCEWEWFRRDRLPGTTEGESSGPSSSSSSSSSCDGTTVTTDLRPVLALNRTLLPVPGVLGCFKIPLASLSCSRSRSFSFRSSASQLAIFRPPSLGGELRKGKGGGGGIDGALMSGEGQRERGEN